MNTRIIKVISGALLPALLLALLTGCATELSGTYESDLPLGAKSVYTFAGDRVSVFVDDALETAGTYEIVGGKIRITVAGVTNEYGFSKDGNTITIAGIEYTRK